MKKKLFHIAIDEPCSESWLNMQPNADGKFCLHCSKTVVDFTQQTSYEIKSYFQQNKENTCGRFTKQQLDETYTIYEASKFDHYKFIASLTLGLLTLDTLNAFSINGKDFKNEKDSLQIVTMIHKADTVSIAQQSHEIERTTISQNDFVILKGTVVDSATNEPLIGVNLTVQGTTIGAVTDIDGKFEIDIENKFPLDLKFSYLGYNDFIKTVKNQDDINKINMSQNGVWQGELVVTAINVGGVKWEATPSQITDKKKEARKYKRKHKH